MKARGIGRVAAAIAASALIAAAGMTACGGDDVTFGGGDDDNPTRVTFTGNLDDVSPLTARDIVVFVFTIDDDAGGEKCPCAADPSCLSTLGKTTTISDGETEFTVTDLEPGRFGVVFLLDNPGDLADGQIDDGDPVAILDDPDCELDDIEGKITVTLEDVDIVFDDRASCGAEPADCTAGSPPAPGRARADEIRLKVTVDEK